MDARERYEQEIRIEAYDDLESELKELERQLKCITECSVDIYSVRLTSDAYVLCDSTGCSGKIKQDTKLYIEVRLREEIDIIKERMRKI